MISPRFCASSRPRAPDDLPDFAAAQGTLRPPVAGTVLRQFNEEDAAGVAGPGLGAGDTARTHW
jgi:septal ring factor EnvC (AmiA/AmiB activator)